MKVKRAYKERFYPTPEQENLLAQSFGCARFVYNNTLRFRTDAYHKDGTSVSHSQAEKRLVPLQLASEFPFSKKGRGAGHKTGKAAAFPATFVGRWTAKMIF